MRTLLVANRGEIAARIMRTARALGLRTVAVYSDADRGAPHVHLADEAVRLGPAPARESYLRGDAVIAAALSCDADAIHPGYGLLSEDAGFAGAVEDAGLVWVGPTPAQLAAFGAKDRARELALAAGVPLLAGSGLLGSVEEALEAASAVGYPVMLKATAGGGGIGMAPCFSAASLGAAFARVERVAAASFGAGGLFLERYVPAARHVEVQLFGAGDGRVLVLGDRDCTLQRRHQKVLEEAPAWGLPSAVRDRLWEAARALCSSLSYRSAGTVEFLYDPAREEAAFLEVNTRLQVEHPVTEAVLGIDLVAWMLRLAGGDEEMFSAPAPVASGCAVEARVYAEDPGADWAPSPGLLTEVAWPAGLRVDGWVSAGTEVTPAYDPLLAKLIASGPTRSAALDALGAGLAEARVGGSSRTWGCCGRRSRIRACGTGSTRRRRSRAFATRPRGSRCCGRGPRRRCRTGRGGSGGGASAFPPRGRWTTAPSGRATSRLATTRARRGSSARSRDRRCGSRRARRSASRGRRRTSRSTASRSRGGR